MGEIGMLLMVKHVSPIGNVHFSSYSSFFFRINLYSVDVDIFYIVCFLSIIFVQSPLYYIHLKINGNK
jgi:hypothetical protein